MIGILSLALAVATWQPPAGVSFQLQLQGDVDTSVNARVFDFDLFDNGKAVVEEVHDGGGARRLLSQRRHLRELAPRPR